MKKIITLLSLLTLSVSATFAADLFITIENIQSNKGNIRLALFAGKDKARFPNGKPTLIINHATGESVNGIVVPAESGSMNFRIIAPAGVYSASAFHDKNINEDLDKSFFGSPNEPYGFSNDARGTFGPPDYSKAQFELEESGTEIVFDII